MISKSSRGYHILLTLGFGYTDPSVILSSLIVALNSFFFIYSMASFFRIGIFILQDRVTYDTAFDYYLVNKDIDHLIIIIGFIVWLLLAIKNTNVRYTLSGAVAALTLIALFAHSDTIRDILALTSLPFMLLILLYNRSFRDHTQPNVVTTSIRLTLYYTSAIGLIISISGIIITSVNLFPWHYDISITRNYAYELFALLSAYSHFLVFLIVFSFPIMTFAITLGKSIIQRFKISPKGLTATPFNRNLFNIENKGILWKSKAICVFVFMLVSISLAIIPHIHTINKDTSNVGVDTKFYVQWIKALDNSKGINDLLYKAFILEQNGDRPFSLLLLFAIVKVVGSLSISNISLILEYTPIIFGPALVLVVYFLSYELTSNAKISLLSSFLTSVSFQTLVGIYAGFYANWFALVVAYISFIFLFRYLKSGSTINFIVFSFSVFLLLFVHNYTWTIIITVLIIFLIISIKLNYFNKRFVYLIIVSIVFSVGVDLYRMTITHSSSGIGEDIDIAVRRGELGINQFPLRWSNLKYTIQNYYGGQFANGVILAFCFYWTVTNRLNKPYESFMVIFLSIGILPLFFGDRQVQGRIIYDIPFQIPAAIALYNLTVGRINNNSSILHLLFVCLWITSVSIRAVSNFYLVLPK